MYMKMYEDIIEKINKEKIPFARIFTGNITIFATYESDIISYSILKKAEAQYILENLINKIHTEILIMSLSYVARTGSVIRETGMMNYIPNSDFIKKLFHNFDRNTIFNGTLKIEGISAGLNGVNTLFSVFPKNEKDALKLKWTLNGVYIDE